MNRIRLYDLRVIGMPLGNVPPSVSVFNTAHTGNGYSILSSYYSVHSWIRSYLDDINFKQLMVDVFLPLRSCRSTLPVSISHIVGVRPIKQMGRVAARSVVAMVAHTVFNLHSVVKLIGNSVSVITLTSCFESSIALGRYESLPRPTFIRSFFIHIRPKSILVFFASDLPRKKPHPFVMFGASALLVTDSIFSTFATHFCRSFVNIHSPDCAQTLALSQYSKL